MVILAAKQCDKVNAALMKNLNVPKIEIDEIWLIVNKIVPKMEVYEDNGSWMWVAFAPEPRIIVTFAIGPGKQYVADKLVKLNDACLSDNKPVYVTDGLNFYKVALLNHYGLQIKYPKQGREEDQGTQKLFLLII